MKYRIDRFKKNNGNITIMVMIIGMVIVFTIAAMTQFVFEDVIFTELHESKVKALNIAEAGISNMLSKIEKFHNDEISELPSSPYNGDVSNKSGDVVGSFTVEYDDVYNAQGKLTNYIITSEGTDSASGQSRKVKINLAVSFTTEVDMFSYIYSRDSLEFLDLVNVSFINGPLFVGGDFVIRDLVSLGDVVTGDKLLVGGNIDMAGYSRLRSKMINVGGDIEMNSAIFSPRIESNSTDTLEMIVMNDIRMEDSSRIGSSTNPVNLSSHGEIITSGSSQVYYNSPIGDDLFDPPKLDVKVYVDSFINQLNAEVPKDFLEIDENIDGTEDGVFVIDPSLILDQLPFPTTDTTEESVKIITNPSIIVTKKATPNVASVGETVNYDYTVTNTDTEALYNVNCVDSLLGNVSLSGLTDEDGDTVSDDLAAGATATGSLTYTVMDSDKPGPIGNSVVATADTVVVTTTPSDKTEESVKIITNLYILVTKKATPNVASVDESITYEYEVTNISTSYLADVICSDSSLGAVTLSGLTDEDGDTVSDDLAAGATATGSLTYTVIEGDKPGPIVNSVVATANSPLVADPVSDTSEESVKIVIDPHILATKEAIPNAVSVGDNISYNYTVKNVGTQILYDVTCIDMPLGSVTLSGLTDEDGDTVSDDLAIGATATGSLTYTVIEGDKPGPISNYVIAKANPSAMATDPVSDTAEESVKIKINPHVVVSKDATPIVASVGESIIYNYEVTNISTSYLADVTCTDSSLGDVTLIGLTDEDGDSATDDLAVGASAIGSLTYTVTEADKPGPIGNSAIVVCTPTAILDEFYREYGDNSIRFYEDGGEYFLEVNGNVLVNGDIRIGEYIDENGGDSNDIFYSGKGKLITSGSIDASSGLVPVGDFPTETLLILMSSGNLDITVDNYNNYSADYNDPDVNILGVSGGSTILNSHNALLGSLISNSIDARDESGFIGFLLGSLSTIGYDSDMDDVIPEDLPKLVYGGVSFTKQWEEVVY